MRLALDLDNTTADHTDSFKILAQEFNVPGVFNLGKNEIKDYFLRQDKESIWTILQGRVYGDAMSSAKPYDGLIDAFQSLMNIISEFQIISHRSKWAHSGEKIDLHRSANEWVDEKFSAFSKNVFKGIKLTETVEAKIDLINIWNPKVIVDDLISVIHHPNLKPSIQRVHFNPNAPSSRWVSDNVFEMTDWSDFPNYIREILE